jgi:hypothetical protein
MPGCVLRVPGSTAAVKAFTARTSLPVAHVFIKGEPVLPGIAKRSRASGFNVTVSLAPGTDLARQVRDAQRFMTRHACELRRMKAAFKRATPVLDFGLFVEDTPEKYIHSYQLPPSFLKLAGQLGFHVQLSLYPTAAPSAPRSIRGPTMPSGID